MNQNKYKQAGMNILTVDKRCRQQCVHTSFHFIRQFFVRSPMEHISKDCYGQRYGRLKFFRNVAITADPSRLQNCFWRQLEEILFTFSMMYRKRSFLIAKHPETLRETPKKCYSRRSIETYQRRLLIQMFYY